MSSLPKILFVGMNPSNAPVTKGSAWDRFTGWIKQLQDEGYIDYFSFTNVCLNPEWKGSRLSNEELQTLRKQCKMDYDLIVSLGGKAREELVRAGFDPFNIPHPSPRNHMWNDKLKEKEVLWGLKQRISAIKLQKSINSNSR